ncbi:MAG TPA: roadblock/LC7 domain-containing protein [Longimicrobium sp.]|jgi:predicted regulator of Ras-like GTPase activity (Roadblock/LC7/MglB family)|nr:roadblock/LC7 domain-containing protein [Longimicrobium sp.]
MSELDDALDRIRGHDGVEHVLVLGRDGLLIQHAGTGALDPETVAAMVPGVVQSASALGGAAGTGGAGTVVARLERGVAVLQALSDDVLLAVLVAPGAGFAPLLHDLAESRAALAALV